MRGLGYKFKITCNLGDNVNLPKFSPSFILESELSNYDYQDELYKYVLLEEKHHGKY